MSNYEWHMDQGIGEKALQKENEWEPVISCLKEIAGDVPKHELIERLTALQGSLRNKDASKRKSHQERLIELQKHVYAIYSHYPQEDIRKAVASKNGSQLYHYGVALSLLDELLKSEGA